MCFSASASFGAGIVLSAIGVASVSKIRTSSQIPFAGIPFLFAVQQLSEGFLWLALTKPGYVGLQHASMIVFLSFAQVIWPALVPVSILLLEKNSSRRLLLKFLTVIGVAVAVYLGFGLAYIEAEAKIIENHIAYIQEYSPAVLRFGSWFYIAATILPTFTSSVRRIRILGASIFMSYIITLLFYENNFISVWCFFAAIISVLVYYVMLELNSSVLSDAKKG